MPIVASEILIGSAPGLIVERHTDHAGRVYDIPYMAGAGADVDLIMQARAARMGAEIDAREVAESEAANYVLPWSRLEFLMRFTAQERVIIRQLCKSDPIAEDFMAMLEMASSVVPGNADLLAGLTYLEQVGVLASGRAVEIGVAQ